MKTGLDCLRASTAKCRPDSHVCTAKALCLGSGLYESGSLSVFKLITQVLCLFHLNYPYQRYASAKTQSLQHCPRPFLLRPAVDATANRLQVPGLLMYIGKSPVSSAGLSDVPHPDSPTTSLHQIANPRWPAAAVSTIAQDGRGRGAAVYHACRAHCRPQRAEELPGPAIAIGHRRQTSASPAAPGPRCHHRGLDQDNIRRHPSCEEPLNPRAAGTCRD